MGFYVTYTVDEEDADCGKCNHCSDDYDCSAYCGAGHAWNGYNRTEYVEEEDG